MLTVARELPNTIFIYTSTSDTAIPCPNFLRLGWDLWDLPKDVGHDIVISDSDKPLSPGQLSHGCYSRTKLLAEQLVKDADGRDGLKTGIIRPGL